MCSSVWCVFPNFSRPLRRRSVAFSRAARRRWRGTTTGDFVGQFRALSLQRKGNLIKDRVSAVYGERASTFSVVDRKTPEILFAAWATVATSLGTSGGQRHRGGNPHNWLLSCIVECSLHAGKGLRNLCIGMGRRQTTPPEGWNDGEVWVGCLGIWDRRRPASLGSDANKTLLSRKNLVRRTDGPSPIGRRSPRTAAFSSGVDPESGRLSVVGDQTLGRSTGCFRAASPRRDPRRS